jgi:hypothetical protein
MADRSIAKLSCPGSRNNLTVIVGNPQLVPWGVGRPKNTGNCTDRLAERSEKGLDRGKSAVKYRVFIGFFADSISDLESFRAFRLNMYLARNG